MSINIHYLSNGKKSYYCVTNAGVTPIERTVYENINDIPESIRHYAEGKSPKEVTPDVAQSLGFGEYLYPEMENRCSLYGNKKITPCLGTICGFIAFPDRKLETCPHWIKRQCNLKGE